MTRALTENTANADFTVGVSVPDTGESFPTACGVIVDQSLQELADRTQWLKLWLLTTPSIRVPLNPQAGVSNFSQTFATNRLTWFQSSVSSAGVLPFYLPPLPVGRKITAVTAWWQNPGTVALPTGVFPKVSLYKQSITAGGDYNSTASVLVGTQSDTTGTVGAYKLNHAITISGLSETIDDDEEFLVKFEGEGAGANSVSGGILMGLRVSLAV